MAKTLRTSGDYTIKAGDGFNSGSGANTITLDSLNVSVSGNLTVGGTSSTISTTNTVIEDNIIELQTGISASSNDSGIIIERGSTGDNAAIIWKEDTDTFILGTTTATAADKSSSLSVTAGALQTGALTATTGTFTGSEHGDAPEIKENRQHEVYLDGVQVSTESEAWTHARPHARTSEAAGSLRQHHQYHTRAPAPAP